ncbi:hypothetical protein [Sulfurospirillum barnesii]|uniref:Uncharacterized protein n=1 Tax=Sulfurospirillum barnesii (strain ATCC 700032 / DSM 10660 / SES-3) TaxID=760154 RepID=I3XX76_SULBS|nr:hypothetical protein [Sulfurospirillum barnesii]AFL68550.1 hypothetical protein Sulba_1256 [Sulfurospirillum barnesii SES-3]
MFKNPYIVHCITVEDFQEDSYMVKGSNNLAINVSESFKKSIMANNNVYILPKKLPYFKIGDKVILICKKTKYDNVYGVVSLLNLSKNIRFKRSDLLLIFQGFLPLIPLQFLIAITVMFAPRSAKNNAGLFFLTAFLFIFFFVIKDILHHRKAIKLASNIQNNIQEQSKVNKLLSSYRGNTHIMNNFC